MFDEEEKIARFIGRQAGQPDELVGVDAALEFPLFFQLPSVVKGFISPKRSSASTGSERTYSGTS